MVGAAGGGSGCATSDAQTRWELENGVAPVNAVDGLFRYDRAEQQAVQQQKPWARDPHFFKQCAPHGPPCAAPGLRCLTAFISALSQLYERAFLVARLSLLLRAPSQMLFA